MRRYESSRRRHPRAGPTDSVAEAIDREREMLRPLREAADVVVDTSDLNVHQLRDRIVDLFERRLRIQRAADQRRVVRLQARPAARRRCGARLPVPPQPALGRRAAAAHRAGRSRCAAIVLGQPETQEFLDRLDGLLALLLPAYEREGKTYLTLAVGLHRRASPIGRDGRGDRRPAARARLRPGREASRRRPVDGQAVAVRATG